MTLITENKTATKSSSNRRLRASASISKSDSSNKGRVPKNEVVKTSSKELFEGRLEVMSSLRKGLTR